MKNYDKVKVGQEVRPKRDLFVNFPKMKGDRFFVAVQPRKSNFPQPLILKVKRGGKFLKQTERLSGGWFR